MPIKLKNGKQDSNLWSRAAPTAQLENGMLANIGLLQRSSYILNYNHVFQALLCRQYMLLTYISTVIIITR